MENPSVPTVHLNGTNGKDLFEQVCEAAGAIQKALVVLLQAAPHGRDYYVQDSGAFEKARDEYYLRVEKLVTIEAEYRKIAEGIADQESYQWQVSRR
jgi:hypothetical protein